MMRRNKNNFLAPSFERLSVGHWATAAAAVYIISSSRWRSAAKKRATNVYTTTTHHDTLHFYFYILANSVKQKQCFIQWGWVDTLWILIHCQIILLNRYTMRLKLWLDVTSRGVWPCHFYVQLGSLKPRHLVFLNAFKWVFLLLNTGCHLKQLHPKKYVTQTKMQLIWKKKREIFCFLILLKILMAHSDDKLQQLLQKLQVYILLQKSNYL